MIFTTFKVDVFPDKYSNNVLMEFVCNFKYLGVLIDEKLTFSYHTKFLVNRMSQVLGILYASSPYLNQSSLLTLYYSLAYSVFTQAIIIYGATHLNLLNPIKILINKMLRIILKVKRIHFIPIVPTSDMIIQLIN